MAIERVGSFRDLLVYEKAAALGDDVHDRVVAWPKFELWTLGIQLVRAADSVGANIAEAAGRARDPDKRRLLFIARGSSVELQYWLDRATRRGLPCPDDALSRAEEVSRMLNGALRASS